MSQKIEITRLHAIHWWGYCDSLDLEGNVLLAGVTGSGKSTLMDLVQLVLVGDQRARYNTSATGQASERDLKSYCLGDLNVDRDGQRQYMREKGGPTYVAMEFSWPDGKRVETWGLRIEYQSAAQTTRPKVDPFYVPRAVGRGDFLDADRKPLDWPRFSAWVAALAGEIFKGVDSYRYNMALPVHLNFDRDTLDHLLPSAMSFTFLRNFSDFCRDFILPKSELAVDDVRTSYKAYLGYERELALLAQQQAFLQTICDHWQRTVQARNDRQLYAYLAAETELHEADEALGRARTAEAEARQILAGEEKRLSELATELPKRRAQRDELLSLVAGRGGNDYLRLETEIKDIVARIAALSGIGNTVETARRHRVEASGRWLTAIDAACVKLPSEQMTGLATAIETLRGGPLSQAAAAVRLLAEQIEAAIKTLTSLAQPKTKAVGEIAAKRDTAKEQRDAAARGRPAELSHRILDEINRRLPGDGRAPAAQALWELCEVTDETWRPALEVLLHSRRTTILVDAHNYDEAESIYSAWKEDARDESLVNLPRLRRWARPARPGTLAGKITTDHPAARALLDHVLGDILAVPDRAALKTAESEHAVTPDGFGYRGVFTERPRHYTGVPTLGRSALARQKAHWQAEFDRLEAEFRREDAPLAHLRELIGRADKQNLKSASLHDDLAKAAALPELERQRDEKIATKSRIDPANFQQALLDLKDAERVIGEWEQEEKDLLRSEARADARIKEFALKAAATAREEKQTGFHQLATGGGFDFSPHVARLAALRVEIAAGPFLGHVARAAEFTRRSEEAQGVTIAAWRDCVAERRLLAQNKDFGPRYEEFAVESDDNSPWQTRLDRLLPAQLEEFRKKSGEERRTWERLFRSQVLDKIRTALEKLKHEVELLNAAFNHPIGGYRYHVAQEKNPDFKRFHRLLEVAETAREGELFGESGEVELREELQAFFKLLVEQPDSVETARRLDHRNYFVYDMLVRDQRDPDAPPMSVNRHAGKFSGGENQVPYFIAILASYLRCYRRHDRRRDPSLAIVPIDEAFSKLSTDRIRDCIVALKHLGLQGVFSMSTGNIPAAFDYCDRIITVHKHRTGTPGRPRFRNIPHSLARSSEEAIERLKAAM